MTFDPLEPVDIPDTILLDLPFAALDRDVPLLLLPVGIETRYRLDADPPALCIRIYPDPIHVDGDASPGRAALLPRQWVALGYDADGRSMFMKGSKAIAADLHVGLDAAAPTWTVEGAGLEVDDGLAWMLDYDRAVEAGMAITIPLTGDAAPAAGGVATLLVVGVDSSLDPAAAQAELSRVLDVHRRTDGLGFVAQGTPTNNTDSVGSGWPPDETDGTNIAAGGGPDNAADFAQALGLGAPERWRSLPGGRDLGSQRSEAMRALLFEAVLGTMARELLDVGDTPGLRAAATNDLRDWFIDRVTGGAAVPCIRIGRQPYGIVPVQRATEVPDRTTIAGQVERIVALVIDEWRRAVELVPAMNPDDPDVSTDTAHESELAAVLAGQPHPTRLLLRSIGDYETDAVEQFSARRGAYEATIAYLHPEMTGEPELQSPDREIAMLWDIVNAAASSAPRSIDEQIERWRDLRLGLPGFLSSFGQGALEDEALDYVDDILENLGGYERSQRPVRWLELDEYAGVLGEEDNTNLLAAWFTDELDEWGDNGVVEAPDAPAGHRPADYLADLRTRFERRSPALGPSSLDDEFLARPPLLYQLLNMTLQLVPQTIAAESRVLRAFDQLADLDAESLEWLVRETLGLGVHRLDAWATSVASERLDELRSVRATEIQIGGFGWVTDLAPRQSRPPGEGFVLAPSLPHAATAAILRAGWQAHGGGDALSPAAIDLRSDRVRAASWLLDGIRRAQPLGELLGQRFERWLHDAHSDEQIRIVRQAVLDATDRAEMAPDQVVDGIELLDLYRTGALSTLDPVAVHAIKALETTFDAVNDVGTFEAVYQLAAANDPRAGAMLDTLALGTASPPELRSVATPHSGRSVEHRVIGLWPPAPATPSPGWVAGDRDHIAPALEAWVASVLPRAADVGFAVRPIEPDGRTGPWKEMTLAELSASALDAVFLLSDDPTRAPNALATLASAAGDVERAVEIDPQALGEAPVSLSEFSVAAIELRRVIGAARPATARDLRPAAFAGEADANASAAVATAEELTLEFAQLGDRLDNAIQRRDPLALSTLVARLARLGLAVPGAPTDAVVAGVLLEVVRRRIANMVTIKIDPRAPAVGIADRLAVVLGHRLPLLGSFLLAGSDGGEVITPAVDLASESDVDDWLDAVAHVRSDVSRLAHAGLLATMLSATGGLRLVAGQSPRPPGERWAARHRPGPGSRVSVVFVVHPGDTPARGDSVCGLVFDQWSEVIPNPDEVAGLTFQYDAPSNRPPQAWLLAVAPRETPWSLTLVTQTLLETLEWAKLRAVAPEDLLDYGRAIPTVFTPGTITRWDDDATEVVR